MRYFLLFLLLFTIADFVQAQSVKKSQLASLTQRIGYTEIEIRYSRPVARGRTLFGAQGLEKYGRTWMPGADQASVFSVNTPILVEGQRLEPGQYSIWTVPGEKTWTFILNRKSDVFHTNYPEGQDAVRVEVASEGGSHMEVMAFYFPEVGPDSAVLRLHWGKTIVPITVSLP